MDVEAVVNAMSSQLTFPKPTTCTHYYPDGSDERVTYGQFEAIMIDTENGWPVNRTKILIVPSYLVTEVEKTDGTRVVFDEPWFLIEKRTYGDGSGRTVPKKW